MVIATLKNDRAVPIVDRRPKGFKFYQPVLFYWCSLSTHHSRRGAHLTLSIRKVYGVDFTYGYFISTSYPQRYAQRYNALLHATHAGVMIRELLTGNHKL